MNEQTPKLGIGNQIKEDRLLQHVANKITFPDAEQCEAVSKVEQRINESVCFPAVLGRLVLCGSSGLPVPDRSPGHPGCQPQPRLRQGQRPRPPSDPGLVREVSQV